MKLFKNVDIVDLPSILTQGILPASVCDNYNWESDKRSPNSHDVVYLFQPLTEQNSFIQYGFALVEVEVEGATKNELLKNDINSGLYHEYVVDSVCVGDIVSVKIPKFIRHLVNLEKNIMDYITWVDIEAQEVNGVKWFDNLTGQEVEYDFSKHLRNEINSVLQYKVADLATWGKTVRDVCVKENGDMLELHKVRYL